MDPDLLPVVRGVILGAIIMQALLATVLFSRVSAPLIRRVTGMGAQAGRPAPAFLRDEKLLRVAMLAIAIVYLGFWWYLGTEAGAHFWASLDQR
jgi:hypothetical protein